jgi:carbon storage regulator
MLVLSRKAGEAIVIDGGIRLTVLSIHGRYTRLGIEAPGETAILRDELPRGIDRVPTPLDPDPGSHGRPVRADRSIANEPCADPRRPRRPKAGAPDGGAW